jgi:hypothetical protein
MTTHYWESCQSPEFGVIIVEPDEERIWFKCARCGSVFCIDALGPLPDRYEFTVISKNQEKDLSYKGRRKITGWETIEHGLKRCKIDLDCDVAMAIGVMES